MFYVSMKCCMAQALNCHKNAFFYEQNLYPLLSIDGNEDLQDVLNAQWNSQHYIRENFNLAGTY